ncbi:peptidase C14 [Nostoc sp. CENA543]|uniref:SUMF1/EgtB/PvdO family nonheme iron enzyme n=1 Tax=Nostoc sp. CENA543 TaxID=1869241 RepID=UPI000CA2E559|nr:SUMF1/EgtB/PvdO family nonheme iron enzyme [Nostoc sp. CENA543]AUT00516.1 peptidase C14 [Nostoc sp. CENA543]
MAKNLAIAIGVNQYDYLQPLNYAKRDAMLMQDFLRNEAGFNQVFFFSDDSPDIGGKSTRPTRANLLRILRQLFETPFMGAGDNFWFFFSGHGSRHAGRDYLMPSDGDPEDIENTAISINLVTERLRRCGADNVVLILDACRSLGTRAGEGIGRQTAEEARQQGVISIFSCSPQEYSYEIAALEQGAFTCALLEGLGIQGKCATVERLNQYLSFRVPELVRQHNNKRQTPYIIAEPVTKSHLILVPRHATLADIATLKNDAYRAQFKKDFDLAKQLWIRVLAAASGQDLEAIEALEQIALLRINVQPQPVKVETPQPTHQNLSESQKLRREEERNRLQREWETRNEKVKRIGAAFAIETDPSRKFQLEQQLQQEKTELKHLENELDAIERLLHPQTITSPEPSKSGTVKEPPKDTLPTFSFEVVTVNAQGKITNRQNRTAKYFAEDLGNGVKLEMVQIPGGTFMMGSPEGEGHDNEKPQHQVTVPGFFMGKYPVTQEQYQAVMGGSNILQKIIGNKNNPSYFKGDKRPVEQVSWDDAVEFCQKLSQKTGKTYRLPSEAEWEYACRAGTTTPFYFGETITTDLVNYDGNYPYGAATKGKYRKETTNVGIFSPNAFGLYDMCGNIWEWCQDVYNNGYQGAPTDSSAWLAGSNNNIKLLRGGSWNNNARNCRSANRNRNARANRNNNVGFRVVAVAVA